eukprot:gene15610-biopygen7103
MNQHPYDVSTLGRRRDPMSSHRTLKDSALSSRARCGAAGEVVGRLLLAAGGKVVFASSGSGGKAVGINAFGDKALPTGGMAAKRGGTAAKRGGMAAWRHGGKAWRHGGKAGGINAAGGINGA